jgi:hypothetical protein
MLQLLQIGFAFSFPSYWPGNNSASSDTCSKLMAWVFANTSMSLGRFYSLRVPVGFLLTFLSLPRFSLRVSLQHTSVRQ